MADSGLEGIIQRTVRLMGYESIKDEQKSAILYFVSGHDVFVALPTGFGKSLCYGCLPSVFNSIRSGKSEPSSIRSVVVVISPLVALMKDQVEGFRSKGIKAIRAGPDCTSEVKRDIIDGYYELVFISPEAILTSSRWRKMLLSEVYQENLVGLVIDEAHCVKKWGNEFRVHYSYLRELRSLIPETVHIMALTATASDSLMTDIIYSTGMCQPRIVQVSPNKENLRYTVKEFTNIEDFTPLVHSLKHQRRSFMRTIIYCQRQVDCGNLFLFFQQQLGNELTDPIGIPYSLPQYRLVDSFSKGTQEEVKDVILKNCTKSDSALRIIICTAAFGMGVECVAVERVIHFGPASDVETYIQQTGRSGRSGEMSYCILLYGKGLMKFCDKQMRDYAKNQVLCRRDLLFNDFKSYCSHKDVKCSCCDLCASKCGCYSCIQLLKSFEFN